MTANTTYSIGAGGLTQENFTTTLKNKLDAIAASANNYAISSDLLDEDAFGSNSATKVASQQSIKAYVDAKVATVVDSAPAALDTLNELAAALGDDANYATTTATSLGQKLVKSSNLSDLTNATTARSNLGLGTAAVLSGTGAVADANAGLVTGNVVYDYIAAQNFATSGSSNFVVEDITGQTALASGLTSTDELVLSDAGALKRMDVSVLQAYMQGALTFTTDTNTTYSVGDGGLTQNNFTNTLKSKLDGIAASANNYTLPEANATTKGGIELFSNTDQSVAATAVSATAARTYGLQLNSAGQGVVNVPWVDTNTTYSVGAGGLTQENFTTTLKNKLDGIEASANNYTHTTNANLTGDVTSVGNATTIATDAVDIAMLSATGTASSTTYLRGDNSWATVSSGGATALNGLTDVISNITNFTDSILISPDGAAPPHGTLNNAQRNVGLGKDSLAALTSGDDNIGIGFDAGKSINSGYRNIAIGKYALDAMTTGYDNIGIGQNAGGTGSTMGGSIYVGTNAGKTNGSHGVIYIGQNAGMNADSTGNGYAIAIGTDAAKNGNSTMGLYIGFGAAEGHATNTTYHAANNTAIGHYSLKAIETGDDNSAYRNR